MSVSKRDGKSIEKSLIDGLIVDRSEILVNRWFDIMRIRMPTFLSRFEKGDQDVRVEVARMIRGLIEKNCCGERPFEMTMLDLGKLHKLRGWIKDVAEARSTFSYMVEAASLTMPELSKSEIRLKIHGWGNCFIGGFIAGVPQLEEVSSGS